MTSRFQYSKITAALAIACTMSILAGCGKPGSGAEANSGPTVGSNAPASTANTVKRVQDKIAADAALKGAAITVKEENGTISLDGTVDNQEQKDKAESIVYAVQKEMKQQGGVLNNLMIKEAGAGASGRAGAKGNGGN